MRVLLVNTSEHTGGAAIAAHRLMEALNNNGQQAEMLVRDKLTDNPRVHALPPSPLNRLRFVAERAEIFAANHFHRHRLFEVDHAHFGTDITRLKVFQEADVVHLHWVNQGMLSLSDIERILRSGKRVVWTLHDMWPCTGICHQAGACERWLTGCGDCPMLYDGGSPNDLSARTYRRKQEVFATGNIRFVACSDWLADIARRAPLLQGHTVESITNPIDTSFYTPGDKRAARRELGLPEDRRLLLFVAYKATDRNKGIHFLRDAVQSVCRHYPSMRGQLGVVPVGREAELLTDAFACPAYPQNYVSDEARMRLLYRAADLLVMPTLADNLPNTVAEAMACGVPCVAFRVGGLPQMIDHEKNGYLARYKDVDDLEAGILSTLFSQRYAELSQAARQKAERSYSERVVAERFLKLYEGWEEAE
ncbi:MAG: glycosyltransferase family 4 protein [Bacteroidaceae bacterium]|nr:glycosyltransferase family 4 protein [Bacteroidaceae bacterium]